MIHVAGLVVTTAALGWMLARDLPATNEAGRAALPIYAIGVFAMLV